MKGNMGTVDRMIRAVLAIAFAIFIITGVIKGIGAIILGVFAFVFALTSILGFCPIYRLLGIHTLRTKSGADD